MSKINIIGIVLIIGSILYGCYMLYDIYNNRISTNSVATVVDEEPKDDHK